MSAAWRHDCNLNVRELYDEDVCPHCGAERPTAAKGQGCPVVVFTGTNVSVGKLRGFTCEECGADFADHRVEASKLVPLDKAYAMNADKVTEQVSFGV